MITGYPDPVPGCALNQGHPVRALGDALMHHGQSRGETKCKKQVNLSKTGGENLSK